MGLIERYGSGIARMTDSCQAAGLDEPQFELIGGGLRLIFRANEAITVDKITVGALNGTLNGTLNQRIFQAISEQPGIQRKDLIEGLGISTRTLARCIRDLADRLLLAKARSWRS